MSHSFPIRLGWLFDQHIPGHVRVNRRPNPAAIIRALKAAGVDQLITFAKCHYGYAYYPTRIGTPHPGMRGDVLGGFVKECRKQRLSILTYVSFGIDGQAGKKHPEWCQRTKEGTIPGGAGYICVCPFTGYLDRLMEPQIAEIIERYRPDGLWFDTMSALAPCYCARCRRAFRAATGKAIPTGESDPLQRVYGRWRHDRGIAMIERVAGFIQQRLPGATVGFNQIGSLPFPERLPRGVTVLSLDPPTYGPQSVQFSLNAAFGAASGTPCEVMPTIFNQGWGDWSPASELRWESVAVAVWARGARLVVGDRQHPEIRPTPVTLHALNTFRKIRRRMQNEFPAADARPAPDVLILHNPSVTAGDDDEAFAMDPRARLRRISGAQELCLDSGANFTVAAECCLASVPDRVGLVVLPELTTITRETNAALRHHVEHGGRLLVAGSIPKVDGNPLDWCGVRRERKPWQDHLYLPAWSARERFPVLVRGDCHRLRLHGGRCVLRAIPAYDAQRGIRYGWGIGPACDQPSSVPVLTRRNVGKGAVWVLSTPIFTDYANHANWQQAVWFRTLLQRIRAPRRAWLDSPHGKIELVLWENESTTWAILIQHGCEQLSGSYGMPVPWTRTIGPIPQTGLALRLTSRGRAPLRVVAGGRTLAWAERADWLEMSLSLRSLWSVIRVDWRPPRRKRARRRSPA
jgi:hypothetical protein